MVICIKWIYMPIYCSQFEIIQYSNLQVIPYTAAIIVIPLSLGFGALNSNKEKTAKKDAERKEKIVRTMGIEKDLRYAEEQA